MPEYLDIPAVAELLGVSTATVRSYSSRAHKLDRASAHPFPDPAIRLSGSPGWNREDVLAWRERRPGRGCGPRPSRKIDTLGRLRAMHAKMLEESAQTSDLSAYDLGRVLSLSAGDVVRLARKGRIPVQMSTVELHANRSYHAFDYRSIERWLTSDPNPQLEESQR